MGGGVSPIAQVPQALTHPVLQPPLAAQAYFLTVTLTSSDLWASPQLSTESPPNPDLPLEGSCPQGPEGGTAVLCWPSLTRHPRPPAMTGHLA